MLSYIILSLAMLPSGAKYQNLLMRRADTTDAWMIVAQESNTAPQMVRVDDLSPGTDYEFAVRAWSFTGRPSAVSATLERTAPTKSTKPTTPSGGAKSDENIVPVRYPDAGFMAGLRLTWAACPDPDFSHYVLKITLTDTDAATDGGSWIATGGTYLGTGSYILKEPNVSVYRSPVFFFTSFARVQAVNRSGVASDWYRIGSLGTSEGKTGIGDISTQDKNDVEVTGITTGAGSGTPKIICRAADSVSLTLSGGTSYEKLNLSLTNKGFSTRPDSGLIRCVTNQDIDAYYDIGDTNSTSTNAVIFVQRFDRTNLSAGSHTFSYSFEERD